MRIGILGTGGVARTLGEAFGRAGHEVVLGSRTAGEDKVTFADAVAHGEVLVNATAGAGSVDAIGASERADPGAVAGDHVMFLAGDDPTAKTVVRGLLRELGWRDAQLLDLGGIAAARGMETYLPLWLTLMRTLGTPVFNIAIERPRVEAGG